MPRFILIFLESSLERVPHSIAKHPAVVRDARRRRKKPEKIILDDSKHHAAMGKLERKQKRGRPDILHSCLLSALDSRASNDMEIYVHTINNEIIWISAQTRIPRNYNRFIGLMEDLFEKKVISHADINLLKFLDLSLKELIDSLHPSEIVVMSEDGKIMEGYLRDIFKNEDVVICIGAFPHGSFEDETLEIMREHEATFVSLGREKFTSLYVTNRIICIYEDVRIQAD
jgi:rRNA small subunit pseudouridine methyltransferase Nep1